MNSDIHEGAESQRRAGEGVGGFRPGASGEGDYPLTPTDHRLTRNSIPLPEKY